MNSALRLKIGNIYFVLWVVPFFSLVLTLKPASGVVLNLHLIILVVFLLIWVSIREGEGLIVGKNKLGISVRRKA